MEIVTFVIERFDGERSYSREYDFAYREGMTVLDALMEIREKQDPPSLNLRPPVGRRSAVPVRYG